MPPVIGADIVEAARRGGDELDSLISAVWPEAYRLAFGILRDRGLAEDAAQEACAAIAYSLPRLKCADAFSVWSYKIMVHQALAMARRRLTDHPGAPMEPSANIDPSDALDLFDAMASLSPLQRAMILLHYYAGFSSREIAEAARLPASTVRFHLMRARRVLRDALDSRTETGSLHEVLTDVQ